MILGAEIAMLVLGFMTLATGKMSLGKQRVVGSPLARQLGFVLLLPIPLLFPAICNSTFP